MGTTRLAIEEPARTMADAIPVMLWFAGPDGGCVHFNKPWLTFRGRSPEQEVGEGWLEGVHPEDWQQRLETYHAAFRERRPFQMEYRLRRADGNYRWVLDTGSPWFTAKGTFQGYVGSTIDITDRTKAEEQRSSLAAIIDYADDAIVTKAPDGTVISWNYGAERLYGYTAEEMIGQPVARLYPPERLLHGREVMKQVRRGERVGSFETVRQRKDGSLIDVAVSLAPIVSRFGQITGASSIAHDITKVKRLEEQYRQAQKMEAIGTLASGAAHDFNNLLTIINGYADVLISHLKPDDPMRESLAEIHKVVERAGTLTRQLLAFSRQQVPESRVLDLNSVVADTEKMLRRLIGEDILLTAVLDPSLRSVKADPGQLQQVLVNLSVNARDAMPQGGRLTIETCSVALDEAYSEIHPDVQPGEYVMLAVSDTGSGMDPHTKARIFEPFFTTKGPGKGTGLGLAVVHGIVKQSGGHVEVYSEVDKGTTFKVYLPAVKDGLPAGSSFHGLHTMPKGNETVLLAEDEDAVRTLACHVLRSCGYVVLEASDGQEALRVAQKHKGPINLLLSDVIMPHLSGRQLVERMAAVKPVMKLLFFSGYTDDAMVRHGVLDTDYAFLNKPFTPAALAQKVRDVLDEKK
jgi:PAS domain S-box-containing protein